MVTNAEEIRAFLKTIPDINQIIAHEEVDPDIKKEYKTYSDSFRRGELSEEEMLSLVQILLESRQDEVKKKALTLLAHLGTISAFQEIENYYNLPEKDLKQWAVLALDECKTFLEHDLIDYDLFQNPSRRRSGNNMNISVLVLSLSDTPFSEAQFKIIKAAFTSTAKELKCMIQSFDSLPKYNCAIFTVLIPFTIATDTLVAKGISRCNDQVEFVFEHYFACTGTLDESDIPYFIRKVRGDE